MSLSALLSAVLGHKAHIRCDKNIEIEEETFFHAIEGETEGNWCVLWSEQKWKTQVNAKKKRLPSLLWLFHMCRAEKNEGDESRKIFIAQLTHSLSLTTQFCLCGFFTKLSFFPFFSLLIVCYLPFPFVPDIYNDKATGHRMSIKLSYGRTHTHADQEKWEKGIFMETRQERESGECELDT